MKPTAAVTENDIPQDQRRNAPVKAIGTPVNTISASVQLPSDITSRKTISAKAIGTTTHSRARADSSCWNSPPPSPAASRQRQICCYPALGFLDERTDIPAPNVSRDHDHAFTVLAADLAGPFHRGQCRQRLERHEGVRGMSGRHGSAGHNSHGQVVQRIGVLTDVRG